MMTCENCGKALPDNAVICPHCGTATRASRSMPQQFSYTPPQQGSMPPQQYSGYGQHQYAPPPMRQQGVNLTVVNNPGTNKSNTPVLVEVLLNVFLGIYGIGWLMAGESTTGVVLLICGFVLYWPILIAIAVFTLGLGLIFDVPIWIGATILNAVLLDSALNRKASQITVVQTR